MCFNQIKTYFKLNKHIEPIVVLNTAENIKSKMNMYNFVSEFHGLETPILMRALKSLEKQHKAEIMGDDGVKFF